MTLRESCRHGRKEKWGKDHRTQASVVAVNEGLNLSEQGLPRDQGPTAWRFSKASQALNLLAVTLDFKLLTAWSQRD